jgi:hypothetical protein
MGSVAAILPLIYDFATGDIRDYASAITGMIRAISPPRR